MKRLISKLAKACSSETGAVTPIMMMMSGILFVSGMAFLGVGASQISMMGGRTDQFQARYNAEQAARIAMWRMSNTDMNEWNTWANFSDSAKVSSYDTLTQIIKGTGYHNGVTDSVFVSIDVDTLTARKYLGHVILYKKSLTLGANGTISYPSEDNAPMKLRGWKNRKAKFKHLYKQKGKFFKNKTVFGKTKKTDLLHTYNGNQTFDGTMADGIHYVKGNVHMHNGVVLNGSIAATGHITFHGNVEINAIKMPVPTDYSHHRPGYAPEDSVYLPAIVALRGSDSEQDVDSDDDDMYFDTINHTGTTDIRINGMIFSTRTIRLENLTLNGAIIGKNVHLGGTYNVTYDPKYVMPPPAYIDIAEGYEVGPLTWK